MKKQLITIFGFWLGLPVAAAFAEDSSHDGKRLALALERPKTQAAVINRALAAPRQAFAKATSTQVSPLASGSPSVELDSGAARTREFLVEAARNAELLTRSNQRRVADLIVWVISSMNDGRTLSPASGPYWHNSLPIEITPPARPQQNNSILQID